MCVCARARDFVCRVESSYWLLNAIERIATAVDSFNSSEFRSTTTWFVFLTNCQIMDYLLKERPAEQQSQQRRL